MPRKPKAVVPVSPAEPDRTKPATRGPEAEWVPVGSIHPWAKNPRKITDRAVAKVARLIKRFGWTNPIIVRRANDQIVAGHTRYRAAQKLGMAEVLVRKLDLTEKEARVLAIADNRSGEETEWDDDVLAQLMREMRDGGEDMADLTFDEDEVEDLIGKIAAKGDAERMPSGDDDDGELSFGDGVTPIPERQDTDVLSFRKYKIIVPKDFGDRFESAVALFALEHGTTQGFVEHVVEALEGPS